MKNWTAQTRLRTSNDKFTDPFSAAGNVAVPACEVLCNNSVRFREYDRYASGYLPVINAYNHYVSQILEKRDKALQIQETILGLNK